MRKSWNFVTAFTLVLFSFCCSCAWPKSDTGDVIWQFPVPGEMTQLRAPRYATAERGVTPRPTTGDLDAGYEDDRAVTV